MPPTKVLLKVVSILALTSGLLAVAREANACSLSTYDVRAVTYWSRDASYNHHDERCDMPGNCLLQGWVVAPKMVATTKRAAVVLLHGSPGAAVPAAGDPNTDRQSLALLCPMIDQFVMAGYVVFAPFRRGVTDTTPPSVLPSTFGAPIDFGFGALGYFRNTGWAVADWAKAMSGATSGNAFVGWTLAYMENEAHDIDDAITKLTKLPRVPGGGGGLLVDDQRIAIVGHSMGGALATMASNVHYATMPKAVVNLSGAGMSWHQSSWYPTEQIPLARNHLQPIMFTRVRNEDASFSVGNPDPSNFDSSQLQFDAASTTGQAVIRNYKSIDLTDTERYDCGKLSPPIDDYYCVHANFVRQATYIQVWIGDVLAFLTNHGVNVLASEK